MTESNLNLSQGSDDMPFSSQNIEQALDILSAEAGNLSDTQNQETALANVNLLRDLMRQTGVVAPMMASQGASLKNPNLDTVTMNTVAGQGIGVAQQVQNLGFVEFTTGLINGTFDAIIGATIKQMEAYAKLVADLAKTLKEFQAENVSYAQIIAHLSDRYPDGDGGTSVRTNFIFKKTEADAVNAVTAKAGLDNILAVVDALVLETQGVGSDKLIDLLGFIDVVRSNASPNDPLQRLRTLPSVSPATSLSFTTNEVTLIHKAMGILLASNMMDHLRAMAREGMARIVITEGSIRTKLTFKVETTETDIKQASQYRAKSSGASVSGYYAGKKWGLSGGAGYSKISTNTVNETNYNNTNMSAEIIGEVNIKFKTETFAPFEAPIVIKGA